MGTLAVYGDLSRDVADSALMLNVLTRPDARDSSAIPWRGIDHLDGLDGGAGGMRIAWSPDLGLPVADPAVVASMQPAIDALAKAGADVQSVSLEPSGAQPALEVIWGASHAALVRDFDGAQLTALDPGLLRLVISTQNISAIQLQTADAGMRALSQKMQSFHQDYDLLLTPTVPITAFAAGFDTPDATRFPQGFDRTPSTWPFNLTRQPAASAPRSFVEGLPIGLQIVGRCSASRTSSARAAASSRPAPPARGRALERAAMPATADYKRVERRQLGHVRREGASRRARSSGSDDFNPPSSALAGSHRRGMVHVSSDVLKPNTS